MISFLTGLIAVWVVVFGTIGDAFNWLTGRLDDSFDNSGIIEEMWDGMYWLGLFCAILLSGEDLRTARVKEVHYPVDSRRL